MNEPLWIEPELPPEDEPSREISEMFCLSRASYFCVPRLVLENMPKWWQHAFVKLVEDLPHTPENYSVNLRDKRGRFVDDPLRQYRRGELPEEMLDSIAKLIKP